MTGKGHPLPGSDEARHNEIPEHLERDKGHGDDARAAVQPASEAVAPDGVAYPYDDVGRGPDEEEDMDRDREDDSPRNQQQAGQSGGGRQVGGGPEPSDMASPGGSSGTGGYGNAQESRASHGSALSGGQGDLSMDEQQHQGPQDGALAGTLADEALDRGARFDEQQGGGRDDSSVGDADDLQRDQAQHQDRGQSIAETESDDG